MPFKSDKQRKFLFAHKPAVARKFARHMTKKRKPVTKYTRTSPRRKKKR